MASPESFTLESLIPSFTFGSTSYLLFFHLCFRDASVISDKGIYGVKFQIWFKNIDCIGMNLFVIETNFKNIIRAPYPSTQVVYFMTHKFDHLVYFNFLNIAEFLVVSSYLFLLNLPNGLKPAFGIGIGDSQNSNQQCG